MTWYNQNGIANLISAQQLGEDECMLEYATKIGSLVHGPNGNMLIFRSEEGLCNRMPFIDMGADSADCIVHTGSIKRSDRVAIFRQYGIIMKDSHRKLCRVCSG